MKKKRNKDNTQKWTIIDKNTPDPKEDLGKWTLKDKSQEDKFYFAGDLARLRKGSW